jgi:hypothetical protein
MPQFSSILPREGAPAVEKGRNSNGASLFLSRSMYNITCRWETPCLYKPKSLPNRAKQQANECSVEQVVREKEVKMAGKKKDEVPNSSKYSCYCY